MEWRDLTLVDDSDMLDEQIGEFVTEVLRSDCEDSINVDTDEDIAGFGDEDAQIKFIRNEFETDDQFEKYLERDSGAP
jgi:hypothetical protein